jgi:hypothetical protein
MQNVFASEFTKFQKMVDQIVAANVMKDQLVQQVKDYSDTFAKWTAADDKINPPVAVIDFNTRTLMPAADEVIANAKARTEAASAALMASQARTSRIIIGVGLATVLGGTCHRADRPRPELDHRAQHHPTAQRARRCHEAAGRWRHHRADSRHAGLG